MNNFNSSPVIVGGVGGSGTRTIVDILLKMNYFMGGNLNESNDYMELSHLFPRLRKLIHIHGTKLNKEIIEHIFCQLDNVQESIFHDIENPQLFKGWGWKVPPNFYILEHINNYFPHVKYIHVIRHGLDMAFSSNQNQLANWGFYFDINTKELLAPQASLKYWIEANKFAISIGGNFLQERFYLLNFDRLCEDPEEVVSDLCRFLECDDIEAKTLIGNINKPSSMGRYKHQDIDIFSKEDTEAVKKLGFFI